MPLARNIWFVQDRMAISPIELESSVASTSWTHQGFSPRGTAFANNLPLHARKGIQGWSYVKGAGACCIGAWIGAEVVACAVVCCTGPWIYRSHTHDKGGRRAHG